MDIRLRPAREDEVALLREWRLRAETDDPFDFFGHRDWDGPRITATSGVLVVEVDGVVVGDVGWRPSEHGMPPYSTAFAIGISLAPEHRGRGIGARAQRLLAEYLFGYTTANRVEATTDVTNVAEQRALDKAGFTREGVLRGAQWRAGAWHDLVSYSLLRGE